MIRLDEILQAGDQPQSVEEGEAALLRATHELAVALDLDRLRVVKALTIVIRRRAEFETLRSHPEISARGAPG